MTQLDTPTLKSAPGGTPCVARHYLGLYGSARSWLIAEKSRSHRHVVVVCRDRKLAEEFYRDLSFFVPDATTVHYPGWETIPFESVSPQADLSGVRLRTLHLLSTDVPLLVVTSIDALLYRVMSPAHLKKFTFRLTSGEQIGSAALAQKLALLGYQRVSLVESVGEVAVHGSVVDLFPPLSRFPIRVEFDGETIGSLRFFDSDSQRSLDAAHEPERLTEYVVTPVRETVPLADSGDELRAAIDRIKTRGLELDTPAREIARVMSGLKNNAVFPGVELTYAIANHSLPTLLDYLPHRTQLVIVDDLGIQQTADTLWETILDRERRLTDEHYLIPSSAQLFTDPESMRERFNDFDRSYLDNLELTIEGRGNVEHREEIRVRSQANTELVTRMQTKVGSGHAFHPLGKFLERLRRDEMHIAIVVGSTPRAERVQRILLDLNFDAHLSELSGAEWIHASYRYPLVILIGELSAGFQLPQEHLVFISENEIFAERSHRKSKSLKTSLKRLLGSLALLTEGDHVVHTDYGIGLYRGLSHREIEGVESDFLQLEYADSTLYLPVHNIGKVQKFVAAEGEKPVLDKLGSQRWIKTKQRVRESVAALAGDLIKLYAARSVVKGWRFEPYGAEDERFAEEFAFDETPDQRKAISEALSDMANDRPMDRLVCGDVGFGKTEVALRAAFKCIQHTRQVAVLVPTTILAEQHRQTFVNRFAGYPFKIAAISRFTSTAQNKETLAKLANGELDVVIGTHRLLSRDVLFKDLGLVIIDEEHRFGVKQKEKLKALKKQVDVLTLTATPIPRTLHMSLLGIRDISVISTPPVDRRVIRTYVAAYDETLVRDVVLRELQRGGQCFFVHNRVQSIDAVAARLQELIPEARFAFAHGQMSEAQLEPIMQRFLKREVDVLVSTTIIESGIDIPNANTILIDRADTFGLAQLYQMRGRVGRSNRQAYCYFMIPKSRKLGGEAQQRLKALQALDDLGLGFNLAMRDMEIRGAGNLLGREQSGSVLAVGFELYSKILKEAVLNLKGETIDVKETVDPEMKLGFPAFIPEFYIPDVSERLVMYQRFAAIDSKEEGELLLEEVRDRFGPVPAEAENLAEIMMFRAMLKTFGVVRAELGSERMVLSFSPVAPIDATKVLALQKKDPKRYRFGKNLSFSFEVDRAHIASPLTLFNVALNELRMVSLSN